MIRHLVAAATTTALLLTTIPAASAGTTRPDRQAGCDAAPLPLPPGTHNGAWVSTGDASGKYLLGSAARPQGQYQSAILWVDGTPRWLQIAPMSNSYATAVVAGGHVLGSVSSPWGFKNWVYSAETDTYRYLDAPADPNLALGRLTGMDNEQTIIGTAHDLSAQKVVGIVWPKDAEPQVLPVPAGYQVESLTDISDVFGGVIVGQLKNVSDGTETAWLWRSWTAQPEQLPVLGGHRTVARDIEGGWIGGEVNRSSGTVGVLWQIRATGIAVLPAGVVNVNGFGDAATTTPSIHQPGPAPKVIKREGTTFDFPTDTFLGHVFERFNAADHRTVAGTTYDGVTAQPKVWTCS